MVACRGGYLRGFIGFLLVALGAGADATQGITGTKFVGDVVALLNLAHLEGVDGEAGGIDDGEAIGGFAFSATDIAGIDGDDADVLAFDLVAVLATIHELRQCAVEGEARADVGDSHGWLLDEQHPSDFFQLSIGDNFCHMP